MANCLVTKLKESINKEGMDILNYMKIRITDNPGVSTSDMRVTCSDLSITYKLEGKIATDYGNSTITLNSWEELPSEIKLSSDGYIYVPYNANIRYLYGMSSRNKFLYVHSKDLKYFRNILKAQSNFNFEIGSVIEDILPLLGSSTVEAVISSCSDSNIGGKFETFAYFTEINGFGYCAYSNNITGNILDFVNVARNVRTDNKVYFNAMSNIYFSNIGIPYFTYEVLEWTNDTIIFGMSNTSIQSASDGTNIFCKGVSQQTIDEWTNAGKNVTVIN